jgi:hypothetical protein
MFSLFCSHGLLLAAGYSFLLLGVSFIETNGDSQREIA